MEAGTLAELERQWRDSCRCGGCCDVVPMLAAEIRRLRAELDSREHTRTVGTAPVIGPGCVRYRFEGPGALLPYPED